MGRFRYSRKHGDLIGAHISTRGGLHTAFDRAAEVDAKAIAIFAKNSNQWKGKELTDDDCALFAKKRSVTPVFTHASYLINLATTNKEFHKKSIAAMIDELDRAERLGIRGVVLHPGAHMGAGSDAGVERIARSLDKVHAAIPNHKVVTLLETSAGQGSCLGCTFEELGNIIDALDDPKRAFRHMPRVCVRLRSPDARRLRAHDGRSGAARRRRSRRTFPSQRLEERTWNSRRPPRTHRRRPSRSRCLSFPAQ